MSSRTGTAEHPGRNRPGARPAPADAPAVPASITPGSGWGLLVEQIRPGKPRPGRGGAAELQALQRLRDLAVALIAAEADPGRDDASIAPLRAYTAAAYLAYRHRWGPLNRSVLVQGSPDPETGLPTFTRHVPRMGGFRHDPDAPLVFALEAFNEDTGLAGPAPILSARQVRPTARLTHTDDPAQALAWCLDRRAGDVDLDLIAQLLDVAPQQVPALLGDRVYLDPADGRWVSAEEYLSGDVRARLALAEEAAQARPELARNVAALRGVQPRWLGPGQIRVNLGAPWIDAEDIRDFMWDLLRRRVTVRRVQHTAQWEVGKPLDAGSTHASAGEWGTRDVDAFRLIELALNGKVPVVRRRVVGQVAMVRDAAASLAAIRKQRKIKERFAAWLWEDEQRRDRLVDQYNTRFNALVPRRFSGKHITVDGLAPWFEPYPHQWEFVARALATPAALCGLPVGAGKTATMGMVALKLRQTGLARKPMVVVPNHLLEQVDRELRQLLPAARILSASSDTISADPAGFAARCRQDWDIILITHAAFDRIRVRPATEAAYVGEQLAELDEVIAVASSGGVLRGRMLRQLGKRRADLRNRVRDLQGKPAAAPLYFEDLGIDYLLIDEAHYYKNLSVPVMTDGFSVKPSQRAHALENKLRHLARTTTTGRYASLFTGTPTSNTMLEAYVMLRYLAPVMLRERGLWCADAWAATFVKFATAAEVTVDGGGLQAVTRPSLFINAPELRALLGMVADIRTAEQLGLPLPEVVVHTEAVAATRMQAAYTANTLMSRMRLVKQRGRGCPGGDNMLTICGDGRRMATDPALVGLDDPEPGKLHKVAANMLEMWRAHPDSLQLGFCDVGTPHGADTQTYGRLRRLLVAGGMPADQVRFVQQAKGDKAKGALFAECRMDGKVAVLLGSTETLGVGTNVQRRVIAVHHVDAPQRPADVQQRDGRAVRRGNRNQLVHIFRYVTVGTFDAYMWQLLTRKLRFIDQLASGQLDRAIEDIAGDMVSSFAATMAAAAAQPLLIERAAVEEQVAALRRAARAHHEAGRPVPDATEAALTQALAELERIDMDLWDETLMEPALQ